MSPAPYQTPRTHFVWWNLAGWVETALQLESRNASRLKNAQCALHVRALPLRLVWEEGSLETLQDALDLLTGLSSGFRQPPRGQRANAPHTTLISALKNRMKKLERDLDRDSIPEGHNSLSMRHSMMIAF